MPRIELVSLSAEALDALARADREAASHLARVSLPAELVAEDLLGLWQLRSAQVRAEPEDLGWITGLVRDVDRATVIGTAGFHARPDARGMVEVGYETLPAYQRQGYARAALRRLLERAESEPTVRVVRASVAPGNAPSLRLIGDEGFVQVGEQLDPEDGLELVFERPAR